MTMQEVWALLETEPTIDKRTIKHAYAKAVKKYHPEENPEEFQRVYAAYQQALEYAKYTGVRPKSENAFTFQNRQSAEKDQPKEETKNREFVQEEQSEESCSEEQERIQQMFSGIKSDREKKISIFRHKWEWYLKNQNKDSAKREMLVYIRTPWFTDIKEDVRQFYTLEGNRAQYQTLLYLLEDDEKHFLYKDIEKWQRMEQPSEQKKKFSFKKMALFVLSIMVIVLVNVFAYIPKKTENSVPKSRMNIEQEQKYILAFLQETYPMAEFTDIELSQKFDHGFVFSDIESLQEFNNTYYEDYRECGGGRYYTVDVADSDISVHVFAGYKDDDLFIGEDFGQQYMRQVAEKQDIVCELCHMKEPWDDGNSHYLLVGCFGIGAQLDRLEQDLKEFMKQFLAFVQSKEVREFVNIEGVSFCVGNCFHPTAFLIDAGEMPMPLLYDFKNLPKAEVMAEDMKYAVAEYYMHMEPWELEQVPQYEDWLKWYEERVQKRDAKPITPVGSSIVTLAKEAGIEVLVFQKNDGFDYISTGDMYRLLKKSDVKVTAFEGGGGFEVEDGGSYSAGEIICEKVLEEFTGERNVWQ